MFGIVHLVVLIAVGAIAGWLAGKIVRGFGFGLIGNVIVGIVGAFIGSVVLGALHVFFIGGLVGHILSATFGAVLLLGALRLLR